MLQPAILRLAALIFTPVSALIEMVPWDVSGGGKLLVRDVWYKGSPSPAYLHITGSGTLTMEGLMVAYSLINQSTPTFDINNFKGNATFINDYTSRELGRERQRHASTRARRRTQ